MPGWVARLEPALVRNHMNCGPGPQIHSRTQHVFVKPIQLGIHKSKQPGIIHLNAAFVVFRKAVMRERTLTLQQEEGDGYGKFHLIL